MLPVTAVPPAGGQDAAVLRRLVLLVGATVLIDTAFYAVIAPLLPSLSDHLHLSKLGAGILTAAYPAGMLVASIPGGILAVRIGPRNTIFAGLLLLGLSTVGFGLLDTATGLDLARFLEGIAGACSWAGGLAWLVAAAPVERRGATIGQAVAAAVGGAMAGPALGALASAIGRGPLFVGLAGLALALALVMGTVPEHRPAVGEADPTIRGLTPLLRHPDGSAAMWLMTLPAICAGLLTVLGSLRLHSLGVSAAQIGAVFLVAAGLSTALSPVFGTLSDRYGRMAPMRGGLVAAAAALACFTLPHVSLLQAAIVVVVDGALATFWAPSMALFSDVADAHGVEQGMAAAMMNLVWALGQIIGSAGSGALAKLAGDTAPAAGTAGLCALTLVVMLVLSLRGRVYRRSGRLVPDPARRSSRTRD